MVALGDGGCPNVDFVAPEHAAPHGIETIAAPG